MWLRFPEEFRAKSTRCKRVSDTAMHRQAGRHQRERKENERQEESLYNILSLQYVASDVYFKCSCVSQNVFFFLAGCWFYDHFGIFTS